MKTLLRPIFIGFLLFLSTSLSSCGGGSSPVVSAGNMVPVRIAMQLPGQAVAQADVLNKLLNLAIPDANAVINLVGIKSVTITISGTGFTTIVDSFNATPGTLVTRSYSVPQGISMTFSVQGFGTPVGVVSPVIVSGSTVQTFAASGTPVVVNIPISPINKSPAPTAPAIATTTGVAGTSQIAPNDPNAGDTHSYAITTQPVNGAATVSAAGLVSYTSATVGTDSLIVTVTDNGTPALSGTVTIGITVSPPPNQAPAPTAPAIATTTGVAGTSQIAPNDPNAGDTHTYAVTTPAVNGSAVVSATGLTTYTPNAGFAGTDSFVVKVTDQGGLFGLATISVSVNAAPAPTAPAIATTTGVAGTSQIAPNDPNVGDTHTYAVTTPAVNGAAVVDATGLSTYTPNAGFVGIDAFSVRVTDQGGLNATVLIAVTVAPAGTTHVWTGKASTAWNVASNWDAGTVPTAASTVFIPASPPNQPIISTVVSISGLNNQLGSTLALRANFTVANGFQHNGTIDFNTTGSTLTVNTGTLVNAGTISDNVGSSIKGSVANTGTIIVNQGMLIDGFFVSGVRSTTDFSAGTVNIAAGKVLSMSVNNVLIDGAGSLWTGAGTVFFDPSVILTLTGNVVHPAGTGGTLFKFDTTRINGAGTLTNNGTITVTVNVSFLSTSSTLVNNGAFLGGSVLTNGQFTSSPGSSFTNTDLTLNGGVSMNGVIVDNGQVDIGTAAPTQFDNITFQNYVPTATPLLLSFNNAAATFNNLNYNSPITTGFNIGGTGIGNTITIASSNVAGTTAPAFDAANTVTWPNQAPAPTAPAIATTTGVAGTSQIAPNDPNAGDTHTYAVTTPAANGTASVDPAGLATYTSIAGFAGADSFVVKVTDQGGLFGLVTVAVTVQAALGQAAYIQGATLPWGKPGRVNAMNAAFGVNNWTQLTMAAAGATPFQAGTYRFIFLDGSDTNALELSTYLTTNKVAIENWVTAGGHLWINSAPNNGPAVFSLGFGGVTLTQTFYGTAAASNPQHAIFLGPKLPVATTGYTGNWFSHANLTGGGITPIMVDSVALGNVLVAEKVFGSGLVLFGTLTDPFFQTPAPDAANLWANIVSYASRGVVVDQLPPTVASHSPLAAATGVLINSPVKITFSEPMNTATITAGAFQVNITAGAAVIGTISFNATGNVATFVPTGNLLPNTNYTVTLTTTGMTDVAGNAIATASPFTFTFTTGASVITLPPVLPVVHNPATTLPGNYDGFSMLWNEAANGANKANRWTATFANPTTTMTGLASFSDGAVVATVAGGQLPTKIGANRIIQLGALNSGDNLAASASLDGQFIAATNLDLNLTTVEQMLFVKQPVTTHTAASVAGLYNAVDFSRVPGTVKNLTSTAHGVLTINAIGTWSFTGVGTDLASPTTGTIGVPFTINDNGNFTIDANGTGIAISAVNPTMTLRTLVSADGNYIVVFRMDTATRESGVLVGVRQHATTVNVANLTTTSVRFAAPSNFAPLFAMRGEVGIESINANGLLNITHASGIDNGLVCGVVTPPTLFIPNCQIPVDPATTVSSGANGTITLTDTTGATFSGFASQNGNVFLIENPGKDITIVIKQ